MARLALSAVLFLCFTVAAFADSKLVYMSEAGGAKQIMLADGGGGNPQPLTSGNLWHLYPEIDGSARYVTYVEGPGQEELNVVTLDRTTGKTEQWTAGKGTRLHPDFSGNGRYLAFSEATPEKPRAKVVIVDLVEARKSGPIRSEGKRDYYLPATSVVEEAHPNYFPSLSSDGSGLVFQRSETAKQKGIFYYDVETKKIKQVGAADQQNMSPALSFDDKTVAYTSLRDGNWDIYLTKTHSDKTVRVTTATSKDFAPAFRADGSLVFASDRTGRFQLYEISADEMAKETYQEKALLAAEGDLYAPAVSGDTGFVQDLLPEMPSPARSSFGAVRVGERIYIAGGHQGHEHTYPPESFLADVEYYDLTSKKWGKAAPRPEPCHGYGLASRTKYIYAFGGFAYSAEHSPKWKSLDAIDRYDTQTNEWVRLPVKLSKPRSSNVVAQIGSKVYLIGGWNSTPKKPKDFEGEFLRSIEVFDMKTETLTVSPHVIPDPLRRALSGVVLGEEIILVGGLGQGASHFELLDNVTAYNPFTGVFRELPKLPFATFAPATGVLGDKVFVFGGMFKTGAMEYSYVNHIFSFHDGLKAWGHTGRYLRGSKGFSMVLPLSCTSLGVLGGHSYEGETDSPVRTFESFGWP